MLTRRALTLALAALPLRAAARPVPYVLEAEGSRVGFTYVLQGQAQTGTMPVTRADLLIDSTDLAASTADVVVNVARVRTGFFFATEALRSASVLDADRHPDIRFRSRRVELSPSGRLSDGARLSGDLTMRGVTQPVTFDAQLFRQPGSAPDDLSRLTITLSGHVSRSAFGATGYADLVADRVGIDVQAAIRATG